MPAAANAVQRPPQPPLGTPASAHPPYGRPPTGIHADAGPKLYDQNAQNLPHKHPGNNNGYSNGTRPGI